MKNTLTTLLKVYGPSGVETQVAEQIKKMLLGHVDSAEIDVMGNLIVEKKGQENGKRIMISAHMDHIGLIVTDVEETGFLRVHNVGGLGVKNANGRHVVFQNGVEGVAMCQPVKAGEPTLADMFVDIGADDKQDALKRVTYGDVCVYAPDIFDVGAHKIAGPAMDDRCACAVLVELLKQVKNPKNTICGVFSTQEEVGVRGATTAAYKINPDYGIAIDVTAWGDTPETKAPNVKLGAGCCVKVKDSNLIASPVVRDALFEAGKKADVPTQAEILAFGGTDAGAIQRTRSGIPTGAISIPCRYVHAATEMIDMRDLEGAVKLLKVYVNETL